MKNKLTLKKLEETVLGSNNQVYFPADIRLSTGRYLFSYEDISLKVCRNEDNLTFSIFMELKGNDLYPFDKQELEIKESYSSKNTVFYFEDDCISFKSGNNSFIINLK